MTKTLTLVLATVVSIGTVLPADLDTLISDGRSALVKGNYDKAAILFGNALKENPENSETLFFLGITYNRQGDGDTAHSYLKRVQPNSRPRLEFELGWSLMYKKKPYPASALEHFKKFLKSYPNDAQAWEFHGRCHYEVGLYAQAKKSLEKAVQLNPKLKPSTDMYLALIAEKYNPENKAVRNYVNRLMSGNPNSRLSQLLEKTAKNDAAFAVTVSMGGGFNSYIFILDYETTTFNEDYRDGGWFQEYSVSLNYNLIQEDDDFLQLGYYVSSSIYESKFKDANTLDHYLFSNYDHRLSDRFSTSLLVSGQHVTVGNENIVDSILARPALTHDFSNWLTSELAYACTHSDYRYEIAKTEDNRDGFIHEVSITESVSFPETDASVLVSYTYGHYDVKGDFKRKSSNKLNLRIDSPLFWGIEGSLGYSVTLGRYLYEYDSNGQFEYRDDTVHNSSVELRLPMETPLGWLKNTEIYARYENYDTQSTLDEFSYRNWTASMGVTLTF